MTSTAKPNKHKTKKSRSSSTSKHMRSGSRSRYLYAPPPKPELSYKYLSNDTVFNSDNTQSHFHDDYKPVLIKDQTITNNGLLLARSSRSNSLNDTSIQLGSSFSTSIDVSPSSYDYDSSSCSSLIDFQPISMTSNPSVALVSKPKVPEKRLSGSSFDNSELKKRLSSYNISAFDNNHFVNNNKSKSSSFSGNNSKHHSNQLNSPKEKYFRHKSYSGPDSYDKEPHNISSSARNIFGSKVTELFETKSTSFSPLVNSVNLFHSKSSYPVINNIKQSHTINENQDIRFLSSESNNNISTSSYSSSSISSNQLRSSKHYDSTHKLNSYIYPSSPSYSYNGSSNEINLSSPKTVTAHDDITADIILEEYNDTY